MPRGRDEDQEPAKAIPTSRLARSARLGTLAAGQAVRQAGTRAANLARDDEAADAATARRQLEAAEQLVTALGTMKGAAMKVGQVLSVLDVGLVPEEHREAFQAKLAALRDAAPTVAFKDMKRVIEDEYGERLDRVFAEFDPVPVAAASIGQVYRARLREDGRAVAVKVQYPGVAAAVRADMANLGLILRLVRRIAPGVDVQAIGAEIRDRIEEELDYELEAANHRAMARTYRGHPFVVVPDVIGDLSREKVVVTEYVEGTGFEELKGRPQAERDRAGEILFRFYLGSMYRHRQFSGDPHPGNAMTLGDGRMAFFDFGLFKRISPETAEFEVQVARLGSAGRGQELLDHLHAGGIVQHPEQYTPEDILRQFDDFSWWHTKDAVVRLTPRRAAAVMAKMADPRSPYFGTMRHENLPPDHVFGRRVELLLLAILGQLEAEANWFAIEQEWVTGAAPATDLGRQEAAWLASRPG
jgi:predicted unusual protein kinase regulating ubiquinone biosynthesis (AarF/ABC1/UbiB family)